MEKQKRSGGLREIATFLEGSFVLTCAFCEGDAVYPQTIFDDNTVISTEPCPVCNGTGVNLIPGTSEASIRCKFCSGSGRSWNEMGDFDGNPCGICSGVGVVDLSNLKIQQGNRVQTDIWSLMHPEVEELAKPRFEAEHFADAVEAVFKHFNSRVKSMVRGRVPDELDGAALMNRAFSQQRPLLYVSDPGTPSGRDIQRGYMQMFAGAMIGIRNPKAHENLKIDATRAFHLLFMASLFCYKLDEANNAS